MDSTVSGETKHCPECGSLLFHAIPQQTTTEEIVAFAQIASVSEAEQIAKNAWILPGIYCPKGCTWILLNVEVETPPLLLAVRQGDLETLQRLLEQGANLYQKDRLYQTALNEAIRKGQVDTLRFLLDYGANLPALTNERRTPFLHAAELGHEAVVHLFIDRGAKTDIALWAAAGHGRLTLMRSLLERGADPNTVCWDYTALMQAVASRKIEAVEVLLESGAEVNQQVKSSGSTALIRATEGCDDAILAVLLQAGADKELRNKDGDTALDVAQRRNRKAMVELLR